MDIDWQWKQNDQIKNIIIPNIVEEVQIIERTGFIFYDFNNIICILYFKIFCNSQSILFFKWIGQLDFDYKVHTKYLIVFILFKLLKFCLDWIYILMILWKVINI